MRGMWFTLAAALATVAVASSGSATTTTGGKHDLVFFVFKKHCYETLVNDRQIPDMACLKFTLSKTLGYGIVTGAAIVKVPQIVNIVSAGFVSNMARSSVYLELLTGLWNWEFNYLNGFPFSTYGETVFIAVQNVALILLLWAYASKEEAPGVLEYLVAIVGIAGAGAAPLFLPMEYLPYIYTAQLVLFSIARFPQMLANFKAGHTGSSSGITLFMNFAGTLARVFTSMQEVKDPLVLINFIVNASINAVLFAQYIWYRKATAANHAKLAKQHEAASKAKTAKKDQ